MAFRYKLIKLHKIHLAFFVVISSCTFTKNSAIDDVKRIKKLESQAVFIRIDRFNLGTYIRTIEDSLIHKSKQTDTLDLHKKLDSIKIIKEVILRKTYDLADSIKIEIDKSMEKRVTDAKYKEIFDKEMGKSNTK
jgi:hypothetical protein